MIKISAKDQKFTVDNVEYTWRGIFNCLLQSFEPNIKQNECRMIGNQIFYAHSVGRESLGWGGIRQIDSGICT